MAATLSEVLGRENRHTTVGKEQLLASLTGMGASREIAESFNVLTEGVTSGLIRFHEPRDEGNTTPTTYREFAERVFKPAYEAAA